MMHVGYACHDIGYHFAVMSRNKISEGLDMSESGNMMPFDYQREFCKAYLEERAEESGIPATEENIENLMFDASASTLTYFETGMWLIDLQTTWELYKVGLTTYLFNAIKE